MPAAAIAPLRAALEARVALAPDDIAARVSLGELNLSVSLAAARRDESVPPAREAIAQPSPALLRARHVVPALAPVLDGHHDRTATLVAPSRR